MARAKTTTRVKINTMRDIDQSPIYACVKGCDGEVISMKIPIDTEIELDNNIIKSVKNRTEMVRVNGKSGTERLISKPTYNIVEV
jgi:hypothetical protein